MEGGLGGVHVPLISDCDHKMSKDYGVLIEEEGVAQRALFIIDPKGIVRCMTVNDADVGRSVDEAQRVLDALVFKDEFGEGCPVDWKKGDKGIATATPHEGKLELKKSWSEWARPKLQRAWSATSQRSTNSAVGNHVTSGVRMGLEPPMSPRTPPASNIGSPYQSAYHSTLHSGQESPQKPPLSRAGSLEGRIAEAMLAQKLETIQAAMQNQGVSAEQKMENIQAAMQNQSVGVAN